MNRLGGPRPRGKSYGSPLKILLIGLGAFVALLYGTVQYTFIRYMLTMFRFPHLHNPQWLALFLGVAVALPLLLVWPLVVTIKRKRKGWIVFSVVSLVLCMVMGFGYGNMTTVAPPFESLCADTQKYMALDDVAAEAVEKLPALLPETVPEDAQYSYKFGYFFYPYYYLDISVEYALPEAEYAKEKARALALLAGGEETENGFTLKLQSPVTETAFAGETVPEGLTAYQTLSCAHDDAARTLRLSVSVDMEEAAYTMLESSQGK